MTPRSSGPTLPSRPCTSGKNEVKPRSWSWERGSSGMEPREDSRELPQRVTSPPAATPGRASGGGGGTEPAVPFPSALRDNRIQLERSTPNELTISISDVVLADEGEYTCSIFTMPVRTAKALVTVLGRTRGQSPCPPALALSHRVCHTLQWQCTPSSQLCGFCLLLLLQGSRRSRRSLAMSSPSMRRRWPGSSAAPPAANPRHSCAGGRATGSSRVGGPVLRVWDSWGTPWGAGVCVPQL